MISDITGLLNMISVLKWAKDSELSLKTVNHKKFLNIS